MFVARNTQIIQNNKFTISLQYLKEEVSAEVEVLLADKHESLLQIKRARHLHDSLLSKLFDKKIIQLMLEK